VWGILDDAVAYAFDAVAAHVHFIAESELENVRLEALAGATAAAAFGGGDPSLSPLHASEPAPYSGLEGTPVYVDGELRGYGESIPMTPEEFINRTATPPSRTGYGFETKGTPRIINFDSPDVV
jgi:hypothetical protein